MPISVIFLQGAEADAVLGMIDRSGATATSQYLRQWDHGVETTDAALTNGYVYDHIPAATTDRTFEDASPYAVTYSTQFRYVSLLRRYPIASEWEPPAGRARDSHASRRRDLGAHPRPVSHGRAHGRAVRSADVNERLHTAALVEPHGEHRRDRRDRRHATAKIEADARQAKHLEARTRWRTERDESRSAAYLAAGGEPGPA